MAKKESDKDFLLRIKKLQEASVNKIKSQSIKYSKEYDEMKEKGKQFGKTLEEIEVCKKILEKFKLDPPIAYVKRLNDVSIEHKYDEKYIPDIDLLKKHNYNFSTAMKSINIYSPFFKTYGNVYVKRGIKKILLPKSSSPPVEKGLGMGSKLLNPKDVGFVLEEGDIIITDKNGYFYVQDIISNDTHNRELYVYPNSEVCLNIKKKEIDSKPSYMDPSKISDIIKKNSSAKIINYNLVSLSLVKGIFSIKIMDRNKNVNSYLKIPFGYPKIEFLSSSEMFTSAIKKTIDSLPSEFREIYKSKMNLNTNVCDDINVNLELCKDKSLVFFGMGNSIKHKSSGKIGSPSIPTIVPEDFILTSKIVVKNNDIYSDDVNIVDVRAKELLKRKDGFEKYNYYLNLKEEYELKLKKLKEKSNASKKESPEEKIYKEKRIKELKEEIEYYKKVQDNDMLLATQMQLEELVPKEESFEDKKNKSLLKSQLLKTKTHFEKANNFEMSKSMEYQYNKLNSPNDSSIDEQYFKNMIEFFRIELKKLDEYLASDLPNYNF